VTGVVVVATEENVKLEEGEGNCVVECGKVLYMLEISNAIESMRV
jgi:hypothetical protein